MAALVKTASMKTSIMKSRVPQLPGPNSWQHPNNAMRSNHSQKKSQARRSVKVAVASMEAAQDLLDIAVISADQAKTIETVMRPLVLIETLAMLARVPLTWYPQISIKEFPWSVVAFPTEPLLSVTRKVIKPVGGVDISPVVWLAILSFINEILLGPQGLLILLQR